MTDQSRPDAAPDPAIEESLARIRGVLEGLRYGSIALTVHDGRVVQIDVTEKKRFNI